MRIRGSRRHGGWHLKSSLDGYTLIEVMIFIGITSFLLVTAMLTIGGRQQQVQFSQSIRDFESKLSDVINDISTGYFPTSGSVACTVGVTGRPIISEAADQDLGTNEDCIYVGKVLQFSPAPGGDSQLWVYNLAGRRLAEITQAPVQSIDEAQPVAVAIPSEPSFNDSVEVIALKYGVRVKTVLEIDGGSLNRFGNVAVMTNFGGSSPANGISEGQSVDIGGIHDDTASDGFNLTKSQAVAVINSLTEDSSESTGYVNTDTSGIVVCLIDDGDRKASVTIKANGATQLDIDSYNKECDS